MCAYDGDANPYAVSAINLGNNPLSKIEVVSSLNCFNIGRWQYHFYYYTCAAKYNPKVFFGAIHTTSFAWNLDNNQSRTNPAETPEKSGSWL